jgi:hypothetical protein
MRHFTNISTVTLRVQTVARNFREINVKAKSL